MKSFGKEMALVSYQEPSLLARLPFAHAQRVAYRSCRLRAVTTKPAEGRDFVPDFLGLLHHHGSGEVILEICYLPFINM